MGANDTLTQQLGDQAIQSNFDRHGASRWVGCWTDDKKRDLRHGPRKYHHNNLACNNACQEFQFFALQNNGLCMCDNVYNRPGYFKQPDAECKEACPGDSKKDDGCGGGRCRCGGPWRNAVYGVG